MKTKHTNRRRKLSFLFTLTSLVLLLMAVSVRHKRKYLQYCRKHFQRRRWHLSVKGLLRPMWSHLIR